MKENIYATCINEDGVLWTIEKGIEYQILAVDKFAGFADTFYLLDNGLWYSCVHFSVTYLK